MVAHAARLLALMRFMQSARAAVSSVQRGSLIRRVARGVRASAMAMWRGVAWGLVGWCTAVTLRSN